MSESLRFFILVEDVGIEEPHKMFSMMYDWASTVSVLDESDGKMLWAAGSGQRHFEDLQQNFDCDSDSDQIQTDDTMKEYRNGLRIFTW